MKKSVILKEVPRKEVQLSPEKKPKDWGNISFLLFVHVLAVLGIIWLCVHFAWQTIALGVLWFAFCGISITGGYHRLFAHRTYEAALWLRLFYLAFGAASVQNSALKWSSDHRTHHAKVDLEEDPYNIRRGFWWAQIGWVLYKNAKRDFSNVPDLLRDRLIMFQHRFYVPLAILFGAVIPYVLGVLWGDPIGALLVAGFTRLALQYHATGAVNSVAHSFGKQPYGTGNSARDHWVTAIITLGEGYHNFHHYFSWDYRNGVRWWQFDPTKWFVWILSRFGATASLKRTPWSRIDQVRRTVKKQKTV